MPLTSGVELQEVLLTSGLAASHQGTSVVQSSDPTAEAFFAEEDRRKLLVLVCDRQTPFDDRAWFARWQKSTSDSILPVLPVAASPTQLLPTDDLRRINVAFWTKGITECVPAVFSRVGLTPDEHRVFVSYRRVESQPLADQLFDRLSREGFDVFLDRFSIEAGIDFQRRLNAQHLGVHRFPHRSLNSFRSAYHESITALELFDQTLGNGGEMKANRAFQAALAAVASFTASWTLADGQDQHLAEHPPQVTWTAELKPLSSFANDRFAEVRVIPFAPSAAPSLKISFICDCPRKAGTILVNAPDPSKIGSAGLRQMRFPGDTDGPLLLNIMKSSHIISGDTLKAQIPTEKFAEVSNVILNQQCMAIVSLARGTTTKLAGPVVMFKAAM